MSDKPFPNNTTAHERLETLFNDRKVLRQKDRDTFQSRASVEADQIQGRFAQHEKAAVVGTTPGPQYPTQPGASFSNQSAMVPDEEPLGFVDEAPIVGEPFEVEASLERERAATQQGLPSHAEAAARGADGSLVGHEVEPPLTPIPTNKRDR